MKIHYFQRYHQGEDVATANTMLLLSRLYQYSSDKFYSFLKSICAPDSEWDFNPGLSFNLQENAPKSRLDAVILQQSFKIAVETKLQGFASMSPPTKELMKLVLEERIAHGGHPILRWNMDNIFIRTDPAGNIKADKAKSTEKIDGAIALIMALDRAILCGNENGESVYESRGLLIFRRIHNHPREYLAVQVEFHTLHIAVYASKMFAILHHPKNNCLSYMPLLR